MNDLFKFQQYFRLYPKRIKSSHRCCGYVTHGIQSGWRDTSCISLSQSTGYAENSMHLLRKEAVFAVRNLFFAAGTLKKLWAKSLLDHRTQLIDTAYQPVIQLMVHQCFYSRFLLFRNNLPAPENNIHNRLPAALSPVLQNDG